VNVLIEYLHSSDNWKLSSELLVNHKSKNSHHSSTALVELDSPLLFLPLWGLLVPAEVETITEISCELRVSSNIGHDLKLKEADESKSLDKSRGRDSIRSVDSGKSIGVGVEGAIGGDVSGKVVSSTGDEVSNEGKLGNTSVLELDVTKTVECLLVGTVKEAKGIPESKRSLGTKFALEGVKGGGGLANLSGGKGGGGGDGGGKDNRLHGGNSKEGEFVRRRGVLAACRRQRFRFRTWCC